MAAKDPAKAAIERARIAQLIAMLGEKETVALLRDVGSSTVNAELKHVLQMRHCLAELQEGMSRTTVAYRLKVRHGISLSTAYDRINEALSMGPLNLSEK